MLEDIRLTETEITDSKMEYFPVTPEDRKIANSATDKAIGKIVEKLECVLEDASHYSHRITGARELVEALKKLVKK